MWASTDQVPFFGCDCHFHFRDQETEAKERSNNLFKVTELDSGRQAQGPVKTGTQSFFCSYCCFWTEAVACGRLQRIWFFLRNKVTLPLGHALLGPQVQESTHNLQWKMPRPGIFVSLAALRWRQWLSSLGGRRALCPGHCLLSFAHNKQSVTQWAMVNSIW